MSVGAAIMLCGACVCLGALPGMTLPSGEPARDRAGFALILGGGFICAGLLLIAWPI